MAHAVSTAMYVDLRMSTGPSRGYLTPYEIITGSPPNIDHIKPFYTKAYVTVPKEKRVNLRSRGLGTFRAEPGRFVGYSHPYGGTSRVLLDGLESMEEGKKGISGNRMVDTISVSFDLSDFTNHPSATRLDPLSHRGKNAIPMPQLRKGQKMLTQGGDCAQNMDLSIPPEGAYPDEGGAYYPHGDILDISPEC